MTGRSGKAGARRVVPFVVSLLPFVAASIAVTVVAHDALAPRADELPGVPRLESPSPSRDVRPMPKPVKPLFESWETIPS